MRKRLLWLFVITFITLSTTYAQSKKDLENDYAKCIIARDSIQKALTGLSASYESLSKTYDSVSKTCMVYDTMYKVIKERIFKYAYKPSNMPALLDSLAASRNSAFTVLSTSLGDSITALNKENANLKAVIETLSTQEDQSAKAVSDLKKLKELLDAQIITQAEFDAKKAVLLEKL